MKLTLLIAFVAVTASVAYAAPQGDDEEIAVQEFLKKALKQSPQDDKSNIEEFFEKALQQSPQGDDEDEEEELQAELQSLLAETEQASKENAELQRFFAREQIPAGMQRWNWRRIWKVVRRVGGGLIRHYVGKRSTKKIQKK